MTDSAKGNPSPPRTILPTFIWSDGDSPGLYAYTDRFVTDLTGANLRDATLIGADFSGRDVQWEDSSPSRGPEESRPEDRADTDPREPESPQVDPADELIDALRRLEVLEPTGYSDIVPRSVRVSLHTRGLVLQICGTSPSHDLKEKKVRRRAWKCLAVALGLILVGGVVFPLTWVGAFLIIAGVLGIPLAGMIGSEYLEDPELTFPIRVAGTDEERRSLGQKLLAASSVDRGIFTSALQVLAGESAEAANPEVRERALIVLRDLYLKSEERRLDLDQTQTIEKLTAVATLEARIEMLD